MMMSTPSTGSSTSSTFPLIMVTTGDRESQSYISLSNPHAPHTKKYFHILTILQLVGLHNFHSIVRNAAAFYLLRQNQEPLNAHPFVPSFKRSNCQRSNSTNYYYSKHNVKLIHKIIGMPVAFTTNYFYIVHHIPL